MRGFLSQGTGCVDGRGQDCHLWNGALWEACAAWVADSFDEGNCQLWDLDTRDGILDTSNPVPEKFHPNAKKGSRINDYRLIVLVAGARFERAIFGL